MQLHQKRTATSKTWQAWLAITALWPQRKQLYCPNKRLSKWMAKIRTHKAGCYWTGSKKKKKLFRQGPHRCHFSAHLNTLQQPPPSTAPHVFPPFPFASDENTFDPGSDQQRHWQAVCTGPGKLSSQGLSRSQKKVAFNLKYAKKPKGFFLLKSIWKQWEAPACRVCHFVPPSLTSFVHGN